MEQAKTLVRVGNILQTIWCVIYGGAALLYTALKVGGALPMHVPQPSIFQAIVFLIFVIVCWMAGGRFEGSNGWRLFLLIGGIITLLAWGNWIAGILFIVAYVKANNAANDASNNFTA